MPSAAECLSKLHEAFAGELGEKGIKQIIAELDNLRKTAGADAAAESLEELLRNRADEIATEALESALIRKRNDLLSELKLRELADFSRQVHARTGRSDLGLQAALVGINARVDRARRSAAALGHSLTNRYMGGLADELDKSGLLAPWNRMSRDKDFEDAVTTELAELSKGPKEATRNPTGNKEAYGVAQIVRKYQALSIRNENAAGGWIKTGPDYIARMIHDPFKIASAGLDEWKGRVLELADIDTTFKGLKDELLDDALEQMWKGMKRGRGYIAVGDEEVSIRFSLRGGTSYKSGETRYLSFSDPKKWAEYNRLFGRGGLAAAVAADFQRSARNTGLMQTFGPRPEGNLKKLIEMLDVEGGKVKALQQMFDKVIGRADIPASASWARATDYGQTALILSSLENAALSALGDIAFKMHSIHMRGGSLLSAYSRALKTTVDGFTKEEARQFGRRLGIGIDGLIEHAVKGRFVAEDLTPGSVADANRIFFKLIGLTGWTDRNKQAISYMEASRLGDLAGKSWNDLDGKLRSIMRTNGLDEESWNLARVLGAEDTPNGVHVLMPDRLDEADLGEVKRVAGREMSDLAAERLRTKASEALQLYLMDFAEEAIPTPGMREQRFLLRGIQAGTPEGLAVRWLMLFKSFPVTIMTKQFGRAFESDSIRAFAKNFAQGKGDRHALVHMMLAATAMGFVANSIQDLLRGKSLPDLDSPDVWRDALLRGGALSIYGDLMFGEYRKFGGSAIEQLSGPVIGRMDDVLALIQNPSFNALYNVMIQSIPGVDFLLLRAALDYLLLFELKEAANPGYLRRMEKRLEEERGQKFFFPPSRDRVEFLT